MSIYFVDDPKLIDFDIYGKIYNENIMTYCDFCGMSYKYLKSAEVILNTLIERKLKFLDDDIGDFDCATETLTIPFLFLLGHSFECSLKSYYIVLVNRKGGSKLNKDVYKYSHDIAKLAIDIANIRIELKLSRNEAIENLSEFFTKESPFYNLISLRYREDKQNNKYELFKKTQWVNLKKLFENVKEIYDFIEYENE